MTPIRIVFDTSIGAYTFVWRQSDIIELFYPDEDEPPASINVKSDLADDAVIEFEPVAFATFARDWLFEHERGIEINSAQAFTVLDLEREGAS